jgi:hypothetical protein
VHASSVNKGGTVEKEIKPIPSLCLGNLRHMEMDGLFYFEKRSEFIMGG